MKRRIAIVSLKLSAALLAVHFGSAGYIAAKDAVFGQVAFASEQAVAGAAHALGYVRPTPPMEEHTAEMLAEKEALIAGINPGLVRAVMHVESRGKRFAESPVGAIGLMQVMPTNAKWCGLEHYSLLWEPSANIRCGVQILAEERRRFKGDLMKALIAYNAGAGRVANPPAVSVQYARDVIARWSDDIR